MLQNINLDEICISLFNDTKEMQKPFIEQDLGTLILLATNYKLSQNKRYKELALVLYEKLIEVIPEFDYSFSMLEGFDGVAWTIQYIKKCGVKDTSEDYDSIKDYLIESVENSITDNDFDFLYGATGKLNLILNSEDANFLPQSIYFAYIDGIAKFFKNATSDNNENELNLGFAHGLSSILLVISKIYLKIAKEECIKETIQDIITFYLNIQSLHPDYSYGRMYDPKNRTMDNASQFAWCYGDLTIIYSLLYAADAVGIDNEEIIHSVNKLKNRNTQNIGLINFEDYNFLNTSFCHGISGIYMSLYKINKYADVSNNLKYWEEQLFIHLNQQLLFKGKTIYFPKERQDENYTYTLDNQEMLNGLVGAVLTLLTIEYKNNDWSDFMF